MVVPEMSRVDIHLSRQLTQHVKRERRTAWAARIGDGKGIHVVVRIRIPGKNRPGSAIDGCEAIAQHGLDVVELAADGERHRAAQHDPLLIA